jgi:hypothetical protein
MDTRKLIYLNLANGVSVVEVANAFGLTIEELDKVFTEVALKLAGHIVFSKMPTILTESDVPQHLPRATEIDRIAALEIRCGAARQNRRSLIPMLEELNLDAGLIERMKRVRHTVTRQVNK